MGSISTENGKSCQKNFQVFFRQWLYLVGQPQLSISSRFDDSKKLTTITVVQLQNNLFEFPIELMIYGGAEDGVITKSLQVKNKETSFSIPMSASPQKIVPDPQVKLLFEEVR